VSTKKRASARSLARLCLIPEATFGTFRRAS
jgi:hypothetical protein